MNNRSSVKSGRYTAPKRNLRRQAASAALAVGTSVGVISMAAPVVAGAATTPLVPGNAHLWKGHPLTPPSGPSSKDDDHKTPKTTTTIVPTTVPSTTSTTDISTCSNGDDRNG
ncbi:MAG: hypothetical protein WCK25_06645, partial [Actinomycetes bacterium]